MPPHTPPPVALPGLLPQPGGSGSFEGMAGRVLAFLHARLGMRLWMLTRTEGPDWIVLYTEDHGYGVQPGTVLPWADSFCSRMVQGLGPCVAPQARQVPAYASAPIGQRLPIQAYVGVPLQGLDGQLFGTLCAIDPQPQPDSLRAEQPLLELLGALLSSLLQAELLQLETLRQAERLRLEAMTDSLTGLYNRRAWDRFLDSEEERCRRYGSTAVVGVVDLDGLKRINDHNGHAAGDTLIRSAAQALRQTMRQLDVVARIGGDEFCLLCPDWEHGHPLLELSERLHEALAGVGVQASIGLAERTPGLGLHAAWQLADARMYEAKRLR